MHQAHTDTEQTVGLLREVARAMRSLVTSPGDEVRAIHAAVNALQARESELLAEMDATKAHEADGCASIATWARRELLQDPSATRQMVRAAKTTRDLPAFGHAFRSGQLSGEHVNAMTYALKHVGHGEITTVEADVLKAALVNTPGDVFTLMRTCKAIVHSDDLDEAWLRGMDKADFQCRRTGDGFHVTGFLPVDVGTKLQVFLDVVSVPRGADDTGTNAERRIDGLDQLVTAALAGELPACATSRGHLSVMVDAETLRDAVNQAAAGPVRGQQPLDLDAKPAILHGFGPIGPALLAYIAWGGDLTPILVAGFKPNREILDVGRDQRLATKRQRRAIWSRQNGRCANSGCHHPIGEIHHIIDWLYGGKTNVSNLAGLCRKCHALVTAGRLTMTGTFDTGFTFTTARAGPLARTG